MNNVNMGGMNAMGGPVGSAMPMNAGGVRPPMGPNDNQQKSQLNTYIYEYFLRNGMFDCARSLLNSDPSIKVVKESPGSRRRDENGNGTGDEGADGDSKDDLDSKRPDDLPSPDVPRECPESCFLYEWWCLFWDMFNAQHGKDNGRNVMQYVNYTQAQSRLRQEAQQNMLRGIRGDMMPAAQYQQMMMRNQANGMNNIELRQKAIQNNSRNATPQQVQMMQQQKQQQMQRDPSSGDHQQRAGSPGSAENAQSPSKRPRLEGGAPFNPQQMPSGRGQSQGMPQQFQNMPGGANAQQGGLAGYQAGLARQQQSQMPGQMAGKMPAAGPQSQGSPMMTQGQDGGAIPGYYNAGDMRGVQPGGQPGGNHALQDYQMQLMLLEQQNKKRLMMARQEQDSMTIPGREGVPPGGTGPNGQPFQQGASPQGARSVNSPNPSEQMKRTPHMNSTGMPSPLPEGQSRGSPGGMNFNMSGGQMDPNMAQQYFKMNNGMDPNMISAMPNGMRPPSSHPGGGFNGQMIPQQMATAPQRANPNWQTVPNGPMIPGPQGGPQQPMSQGTPQRGAMPPPSAVSAGNATNGRTNPSSPLQGAAPPTPQQSNKGNPKKKNDAKETKATKRAAKRAPAANLSATPSADASQEPATPTPATPITPVHPKSFTGQNGAVQPVANGQTAAPPTNNNVAPPQPAFGMGDTTGTGFPEFNMDFTNPNDNMDVLQDFDFDSFLHPDGEGVDNFDFNSFGSLDGNEIGAE